MGALLPEVVRLLAQRVACAQGAVGQAEFQPFAGAPVVGQQVQGAGREGEGVVVVHVARLALGFAQGVPGLPLAVGVAQGHHVVV